LSILYPGSFDPFTNGHLDILLRASKLFPKVIVAVGENSNKTPLLSLEARKELIDQIIKDYNISHKAEVITYKGLLATFVKTLNITLILRGVRMLSDFEMEMQLALNNQSLNKEMETVFLFTNPIYGHISSSTVKEIYRLNGDIKDHVPSVIYHALMGKVL
jgi:pantetheine-phosphate adenylyltransferase